MNQPKLLTREVIAYLRNRFRLDWQGIHGAGHWARVRRNGLRLAERTGADPSVIEIFAFFHDVERLHDGNDPGHGSRAAALVAELNGTLFTLGGREVDWVIRACEGHSDGYTRDHVNVMTCWDADRLDLGRVGIRPHPSRLCTDAAQDPLIIEWAYGRSLMEQELDFTGEA